MYVLRTYTDYNTSQVPHSYTWCQGNDNQINQVVRLFVSDFLGPKTVILVSSVFRMRKIKGNTFLDISRCPNLEALS